MPPKIKITESAIIEAAIQIIRESGLDHLNARELARYLNCSTQPIFRTFENMEELKKSLYEKVELIYNEHMQNGMNHGNPFLGIGLAYIDFAQREKNLFKLLFMSDYFKVKSVFEMIEGDNNNEIIAMLVKMTGLNHAASKQLFVDIWLVTHGIASMMATNSCSFSHQEIESILRDAFMGFKYQLTLNERGAQ